MSSSCSNEFQKTGVYPFPFTDKLILLKSAAYLQGCHGDTDGQNRLVASVGKGEGGRNWEFSMGTETFSSVQSLSSVWLFVIPWTVARQASLSINSWSLLKLMYTESVMPSTISSSAVPFSSHLQSFPLSGSFQMSQFFAAGGQSIVVSAKISWMNIQDWFPLGWTGWVTLLSKGLSRVFSNSKVQKHQFFDTQLSV